MKLKFPKVHPSREDFTVRESLRELFYYWTLKSWKKNLFKMNGNPILGTIVQFIIHFQLLESKTFQKDDFVTFNWMAKVVLDYAIQEEKSGNLIVLGMDKRIQSVDYMMKNGQTSHSSPFWLRLCTTKEILKQGRI